MSMSLADHHRRLRDLETALGVLRDVALGGRPALGDELAEAARRLRSSGEKGAADLLLGEPARAPYRR
jgi:hypothetical protein